MNVAANKAVWPTVHIYLPMVFPRGNKFSLVVAVDNPLHVSLIVTISDKSILVDEIGWKFLHGNLYRYPCLALP